jgi:hypothetical protein
MELLKVDNYWHSNINEFLISYEFSVTIMSGR